MNFRVVIIPQSQKFNVIKLILRKIEINTQIVADN